MTIIKQKTPKKQWLMDPSSQLSSQSITTRLPPLSTSPTCESRKSSLRLTYGSIAAVGIGLMLYRIVSAYKMEGLFRYESGSEKEKNLRVSTRGTLTSAFSSIVLLVLSFLLQFSSSADQMTLSLLFQLAFGNLVGYVLDISFGSEEGVRKMKEESVPSCIKFGISSLSTSNFARYVITVLLDMFISSLFMEYVLQIPSMTSGITNAYLTCPPADTLLPIMASVLVALLTFYGFVNNLRFKFAIRSNHFPEDVSVWKRMARNTNTYKKYMELGTLDSSLKDLVLKDIEGEESSFLSLFGRDRDLLMKEGPDPSMWVTESSRNQINELNKELIRGKAKTISYISVCLASILASLMFLMKETNGGKGVSSLKSKMLIVCVMFGMMIYLDSDPESPPTGLDETNFRNGMGIVSTLTLLCVMTSVHTSEKKMKHVFGLLISSLLVLAAYTSTTSSWNITTPLCLMMYVIVCLVYYVFTSDRKVLNKIPILGNFLPFSRSQSMTAA